MRLEELVCGELSDLLAKIRAGQRLGREDFLRLWNTQDLTGLGAVANFARERASGGRTIYRHQAHLDCTGRPITPGSERDDQRQPHEFDPAVRFFGSPVSGHNNPTGEIYFNGGLTAERGVEDLCTLVQRIRTLHPQHHIRAFSWSELQAAGERDKREPASVLAALVEAGIDSLAGGMLGRPTHTGPDAGPAAIQSMELSVPWVQAAAELGLRSEFAWVRADGDNPETLADLLLCVRELQDRWTVLETCAPLPFRSRPGSVGTPMPTGFNQLRAIATARLFMDNIPRIQSPIAVFGESVALTAQWYGADDIGGIPFPDGSEGGTAGAPEAGSENVIELIRTAGREPIDLYAGA